MSNYTIEAHLFATYYDTALLSTFGTCTQLLLFGNLLVLLLDTTYLLHTPIRASRSWLVAVTYAMGLFAAVHLALQIAITVLSGRSFYLEVQGDAARASSMLSRAGALDVAGDYLLVANNIVTDGLFLHRCYVIWGRKMKVVIVPAFSFVATAAGRIWWIRRDVVSALEPSIMRVYGTVIAMILESGAIYCMSIVLYLIFVLRLNKPDSLPAIPVFRAAIPQIMNIAPILILVRVGSGSSVGDETNSYGIRESSCWTQHSLVMHSANIRQPEVALSAVEGLER
ncbi:hypothetical protein DFH08DRAFT_944213 [Mycena albidolilacea]|uniref:Uncharacterized protein n=1 Tax=Mycena albidolilacea TaxID=1033008 RepID=A0AAD7EC06_9AGAR|nr:hypothetical protein DFH08DRAFT_944213 [Mycena albidolilacea]